MRITTPNITQFKRILFLANAMKLDSYNASPEQFAVALNDANHVLGFARVVQHNSIKELATLGVTPKHRNQGAAKAIVHYLQQENTDGLHLVTIIPEYFESLGFTVEKETPNDLQSKMNNCALWHGYGVPVVMSWFKYKN